MSEIAPNTGEGNAPDLSALLGSLGQKEGGPDLSSLLGMITGGGPEGEPAGSGSGGVDFASLLGMLGGGNLPDIDPRLIQLALRVWTEYSAQDNDKAALLGALKPFLKAERLEKMEKAEKIARLSRVVRVAIQLFKEEGEHV